MVVAGAQTSECVPRFGAIEGGDHLLAATGFLLMAVASSRPGGLSAAERQLFANAPRNFLFLVGAVYGAENCYVRTFQGWLKDPPDRPSDLLSCAA
jgi:hypothetical protein